MAKAKYFVTPSAQADINEIVAYIRERSPQSAKAVRVKLYQEIARLAEFPNLGHTRDDIDFPGVRFWSVYAYLIVYRPDPTPIMVIRVLHGARDLPRILGS